MLSMRISKPKGKYQVLIKVEMFWDLYSIKSCSKSGQTGSYFEKEEISGFMKST